MEFEIPVLKYSAYNLTKFDFSFTGIKIYNIKSEDFKIYIDNLNNGFTANFSFFNSIIQTDIHTRNDDRFAIVADDYRLFDKQKIYNVYHLLMILFPSGLQIDKIVHYRVDNSFVQRSYMSTVETKYYDITDYLHFDDEYLDEVNEYINLVFDRIIFTNYIGLSIENYINSFNVSHLHFSYIALCISLENLLSGSQELSYRLKRTVAILCGKNEAECKNIFINLTKIYTLRSKIVHGETYTSEEISSKMEYLKYIVSRVLIELLIHNIPTNVVLNDKITALGYGQRNLLSDNWKKFKLNISSYHKIGSNLQ